MTILYQKIAERILSEFKSGVWLDGVVIPSEAQLQSTYDVSRTTVRRALSVLERGGHIERRRGVGSFYCENKIRKRISSPIDFHSEGRTHGHEPATRTLSYLHRQATMSEIAVFGPEARQGVTELKRLRLLDSQPSVYQTSVLCDPRIQDMRKSDFENISLYGLLKERFDIVVSHVNETLEAVNASLEVARIMSIAVGAALFNSHRAVQDQAGRVIELSNNFVRADRYYFAFNGWPEEFTR